MKRGAFSKPRRWLHELSVTDRSQIRLTVVAGVLAGLATIVQMGLFAAIVHQGIVDGVSANELLPWFLALAIAILIRGLAQGLQAAWAANSSRCARANARRQLNAAWQAQGPVALHATPAGTLAREWLDHVEALHGYFARYLPQLVLCVVVPLIILAVVFWLDWLAALLLLLSAPLIPLFMALVGMGAEKVNRRHFEVIGRLSGQFLDKVRGLTTLQLFGAVPVAAAQLSDRSDQYRRVTMKTLRVAFLSSAVLEFFSSMAIAVVAIYIGFGLLGYIRFGPAPELTLFSGLFILMLAPEFFQPLRLLAQHYHDRAAALGAAAEILTRIGAAAPRDSTPTAGQGAAQAPTGQDSDGIVLTGVEMKYPHRPAVLAGLDLHIHRGNVVAVTGPSGGGKSTLLYLLAGFISPTAGQVRVFSEDPGIRPFGWLGQSPFLIHGSWADNLRVTVPEASDIAIEAALKRVGLGPLLDTRSRGIHSQINEDGSGLSGGQVRRLSLARAFLADYDLILLDEPTAGLDADSEVFVLESLRQLAETGKTLVFSTHHQALLTLADRILLVADGEVRDA